MDKLGGRRDRRGKSLLQSVQEEDNGVYDPRTELRRAADATRITKSCSPPQRRHLRVNDEDEDVDDLRDGSASIMDSLSDRHRVHDWVNFNVKNLGADEPQRRPRSPERRYHHENYYFKSQIPGKVSRRTLRSMGNFDDDPPLCTSELRSQRPRPSVWDRFDDIRETSSSYFFDDPDRNPSSMMVTPGHLPPKSLHRVHGPLSLSVPPMGIATSNGESRSPASSSKVSYDSTGPNDERYYGKMMIDRQQDGFILMCLAKSLTIQVGQ